MGPRSPLQVLGYCRVSSQSQGDHGTSLEAQQAEIERYCKLRGWRAPLLYVEVESGGAEKIERRHDLKRLVGAAKPGAVVLVSKVDRWSRDIVYAVSSVRQLVAREVGWISIGEGIDASTANGDSMLGIMAWAADQERKRIRERTVLRRQALRAEGSYVEGSIPFGFKADRERRTLVIDEPRAAIIRDIFARAIRGQSTREIADAMADEHPGTPGLDFAAVARKLRSRLYLGEMRPAARKDVPAKPGDTWISDAHPAIIDRQTFARAQASLAKRRANGRPTGAESRTAKHLLRGIATCGECNARLAAHHPGEGTSTKHDGWYLCRHRMEKARSRRPCLAGPYVRRDKIDPEADAAALARLEQLGSLLARPETAPPKTHAPDFAARRARIASARARLVDAIAAGVLSHEDARRKLADLDEQASKVDHDEAAVAPVVASRPRRERLAEVKALARGWARLGVEEKRKALSLLADSIAVTGAGKLKIRWKQA